MDMSLFMDGRVQFKISVMKELNVRRLLRSFWMPFTNRFHKYESSSPEDALHVIWFMLGFRIDQFNVLFHFPIKRGQPGYQILTKLNLSRKHAYIILTPLNPFFI